MKKPVYTTPQITSLGRAQLVEFLGCAEAIIASPAGGPVTD